LGEEKERGRKKSPKTTPMKKKAGKNKGGKSAEEANERY